MDIEIYSDYIVTHYKGETDFVKIVTLVRIASIVKMSAALAQ